MLSRLFIAALWSPAGEGLTSWLSFVMFNCAFVTFLCGILGQVWYLIVSIPDLIFATFLTLICLAVVPLLLSKKLAPSGHPRRNSLDPRM